MTSQEADFRHCACNAFKFSHQLWKNGNYGAFKYLGSTDLWRLTSVCRPLSVPAMETHWCHLAALAAAWQLFLSVQLVFLVLVFLEEPQMKN